MASVTDQIDSQNADIGGVTRDVGGAGVCLEAVSSIIRHPQARLRCENIQADKKKPPKGAFETSKTINCQLLAAGWQVFGKNGCTSRASCANPGHLPSARQSSGQVKSRRRNLRIGCRGCHGDDAHAIARHMEQRFEKRQQRHHHEGSEATAGDHQSSWRSRDCAIRRQPPARSLPGGGEHQSSRRSRTQSLCVVRRRGECKGNSENSIGPGSPLMVALL